MKWLLVVLILAVLFVAGCTQTNAPVNSIACKSDWVYNLKGNPSEINPKGTPPQEICKDSCYQEFQTNTSKLEELKSYNCHCKDLQASLVLYPKQGDDTTQLCITWCQTQGKLFDSLNEHAPYYKCYCDTQNCNPNS